MLIFEGNQTLLFSELCNQIPTDISAISREVKQLVALGYLKKKALQQDKRQVQVSITVKGKNFYTTIQKSLNSFYQKHFQAFSRSEIKELEKILTKLAQAPLDLALQEPVANKKIFTVKNILEKKQLKAARSFLVETSVSLNCHHKLSHSICAPDNFITALYIKGELSGVYEIEQGEKGWSSKYFITNSKISENHQKQFAQQTIHYFFKEIRSDYLKISNTSEICKVPLSASKISRSSWLKS